MFVIIEHLETGVNRWLLAEYEFVEQLFSGSTLITNVKARDHIYPLSSIAPTMRISVVEMLRDREDVIVLDPQATKLLEPEDLDNCSAIVIGGIMGDHPPRGRTKTFVSNKMPKAKKRSLGSYQFTIAGAAYMLKMIASGRRINDINIVVGLKISRELGKGITHVIELPYAFPVDESGNPVLPRKYIEIVAEYAPVYEQRLLTRYSNV